MRTLDRYLIRETLGPFALALALFTFLLWVQPMLKTAEMFIAKGAPIQTIGYLLLTLLPQALGITVPMAFLAGVVMALRVLVAWASGLSRMQAACITMRPAYSVTRTELQARVCPRP